MTTITTAKLREIAHALGTTPCDVFTFAHGRGVTIDDTPADTEEQAVGKMTITQEQFEQVVASSGVPAEKVREIYDGTGITITPAEPPAEMVKLAGHAAFLEAENARLRQHIADEANRVNIAGSAYDRAQAALDEIVAGIKSRACNALGAGGRDAG